MQKYSVGLATLRAGVGIPVMAGPHCECEHLILSQNINKPYLRLRVDTD